MNYQTFSDDEMRARNDKLRKVMEDTGVCAVIATSFHNTLYYSNFWMTPFGRGHFAVLPGKVPVR